MNDNGQTGTYDLRVYSQGAVGVESAPPAITALNGMAPNPNRGTGRIHFSLATAAPVAFDVLDLQGRVVSEIPGRAFSAGRWEVGWESRSRAGERLAAGVYFVRMKVSDRTVAIRKFAVIE